mmetsp:Transcript_68406/g.142634  ORF Transcript_68406/g.142634 Transcript_68406/m.142634 type:complete len:252 (+) Transcript_68406:138-893(+)
MAMIRCSCSSSSAIATDSPITRRSCSSSESMPTFAPPSGGITGDVPRKGGDSGGGSAEGGGASPGAAKKCSTAACTFQPRSFSMPSANSTSSTPVIERNSIIFSELSPSIPLCARRRLGGTVPLIQVPLLEIAAGSEQKRKSASTSGATSWSGMRMTRWCGRRGLFAAGRGILSSSRVHPAELKRHRQVEEQHATKEIVFSTSPTICDYLDVGGSKRRSPRNGSRNAAVTHCDSARVARQYPEFQDVDTWC